eukprot:TRINITY_DN7293_c0_g1_i1.p1 TRINITY_DN7293_c0_g1~~TRINITY_DN7293_c0_g1_i1.p1  ORF type:complete len:1163 (-),score=108.11 TRINITY_DN7293_c0_g1_i1:76-3108(-)
MGDIRSHLNAWRERVPNKWEDITVWHDLITWRQHVFSLVSAAFHSLVEANNSAGFLGYHETAWSINKIAHISRKHGLVDACLTSLNKIIYLPNIEIQDAFVKLREQVKCYFQMPAHYRTGLDIINSTNLDFFGNAQKAEFFQLKGEFLHKMGYMELANGAFSTSVSLYDALAQGWISWGRFCDRQFLDCKDQKRTQWAELVLASYLLGIRSKPSAARSLLARVLWLVSYDEEGEVAASVPSTPALPPATPQEAEKMDTGDVSTQREESHTGDKSGVTGSTIAIPGPGLPSITGPGPISTKLTATFDTYAENVPVWVWIPFIPLLLQHLLRNTAPVARGIIVKISTLYPQSIYYPLRTFLLELKSRNASAAKLLPVPLPKPPSTPMEVTSAAPQTMAMDQDPSGLQPPPLPIPPNSTLPDQPQPPPINPTEALQIPVAPSVPMYVPAEKSPYRHADEIMGTMRQTYPAVVTKMEEMVNQVSRCIFLVPVDSLTPALKQLQKLCHEYPACMSDEISKPVLAHLNYIRYHELPLVREESTSDMKKKFIAEFFGGESDTEQEKETEGTTTRQPKLLQSQVLEKTRAWLKYLQDRSETWPKNIDLEGHSRYLTGFKSNTIEVPGQYFEYREPGTDHHIHIDGFQPELKIRNGQAWTRTITLRGTNGKLYPFHLLLKPPRTIRSEERACVLLRLLNEHFNRRIETRKRNLNFSVPALVSFSPSLRLLSTPPILSQKGEQLVEDDVYTNLATVWDERYCQRHSIDPFVFSKMYSSAREIDDQKRLDLYNTICRQVPDDILIKYVMEQMGTYTHLFHFKKRFAATLGLRAVIGHILYMRTLTPQNTIFSPIVGNVLNLMNSAIEYNAQGRFADPEAVPLRLSRNMAGMLNPCWINGPFAATMVAAAQAIHYHKSSLWDYLHLYLRDELEEWRFQQATATGSNGSAMPTVPIGAADQPLRGLIQANLDDVMQRIDSIAPVPVAETLSTVAVTAEISRLVSLATAPQTLALMDPTWLPFF